MTIGEPALVGTRIRLCARQLDQASLELQAPGVLSTDVGLTMQVFPADSGLPVPAAACAPDPGGPLFRALERGARVQLCDTRCRLISAKAEPVRYNPASRCVIRYRLALERSTRKGTLQRDMTLFGKVYRDPGQAREVHAWMQQFYAEHAQSGEPIVPRPLGIAESLGLTLSEAIESPQGLAPETVRTGLRVFQPRGSEEVFDVIPDRELRLTAVALARLHTSAVWPAGAPRTGAVEARRVSERAAEIASRYPAQAETAQKIANQLTSRLERLQPGAYRPAHGGFKPSQLLFLSQRVFVMDFDGLCLADPALDAGYFLAYLRPSGLWRHRAGMRQWFEDAAASFATAYSLALREHCVGEALVKGILERMRLYEAVILFKSATQRVHHINSPRPGELCAMLAEAVGLKYGSYSSSF